MRPALWCLGLFVSAFTLHLILWRIKRPFAQRAALLRIFGVVFLLFLVAAIAAPLLTFWECIHVAICYVPFSLSYIVLYSAIEADSPSLTVVKFVAAAGPAGRDYNDFKRVINDTTLVEARVKAMIDEGMAVREGRSLGITPKGLGMARFFFAAAKLLNLNPGG
jgi:hypothetical protein